MLSLVIIMQDAGHTLFPYTTLFRSPVLEGELYGPLRDLDRFNSVSIDSEVHTLVWPNGADFDPAILHDWPDHEAGMIALAQQDRKSTHLNSSHQCISYAVFCSKKKR